jgi:phage tail-like protein
MPQVGDIYESFRTNEFVLMIDGVESPGISKISGLSEGEVDTIEQANGGLNRVHKIAGTVWKFEALTLERYVDESPEDGKFKDWFRQTFNLSTTTPGGSGVRKNGLILKKHNGRTVMKFAFYRAWIKSSKFTDLEAGSNNLFKQTIVLEHEGLERVD